MPRPVRLLLCCLAAAAVLAAAGLSAAVTPDQRKELAAITKEVGDSAKLVRKKELEEAEKVLDEAQSKLDALIQGGVPETERMVGIIRNNIALRRKSIALQRGEKPSEGTSFTNDVAPIIQANCLNCHGATDPRGRLRLDTFAGWKQGGASGRPIVVSGNPQASPLAMLLVAQGQARMPKGRPALAQTDIQTIARWILEGAKFDGKDDASPIGESADAPDKEPVVIAKPKGTETVSFTKDVAPLFVNICGRCHAGNNPRGGYNMATFEGVMQGGESGQVITPGDTEKSRLWLMVSNREQPRMPPGQLLITRPQYDALTTWIKEGATFDADDPKKPLRDLVPTADQMRTEGLAKLSPEEFVAHRRTRSEEQWKRAYPRKEPASVETDELLVYGDLGDARLKQVAAWADEQAKAIRSTFSAKETPLWKGKLALFVSGERFGYEEFALVIDRRSEVPAEVHGHVVVSPDYDDAYVALEDVGDAASAAGPGMKGHLASLLTQAYLERGGSKLPDWAVRGTGLWVAADATGGDAYFDGLKRTAAGAIGAVSQPDRVFADGAFPPGESAAVGYALVDFLVKKGGKPKFAQFLTQLASTDDVAGASQAAYGATPAALATGFLQGGVGATPRRRP